MNLACWPQCIVEYNQIFHEDDPKTSEKTSNYRGTYFAKKSFPPTRFGTIFSPSFLKHKTFFSAFSPFLLFFLFSFFSHFLHFIPILEIFNFCNDKIYTPELN